jgi:ribosomal RNA-processing protein 9
MHSETEGLIETPRWVTAIASLRYSDLLASGESHTFYVVVFSCSYIPFFQLGSWEGEVRLWKLDPKLKSFSLIGTVPAPGCVNSIQLISTPKDTFPPSSWARPNQGEEPPLTTRILSSSKASTVLLVAGMGQEHRLGRWMKMKGDGIANGTIIVALHPRALA